MCRVLSGLRQNSEIKRAGAALPLWYFGNPAVSVRPYRLSAPPSRVVKYYRVPIQLLFLLVLAKILFEYCVPNHI
jgi:hypothetical protein